MIDRGTGSRGAQAAYKCGRTKVTIVVAVMEYGRLAMAKHSYCRLVQRSGSASRARESEWDLGLGEGGMQRRKRKIRHKGTQMGWDKYSIMVAAARRCFGFQDGS